MTATRTTTRAAKPTRARSLPLAFPLALTLLVLPVLLLVSPPVAQAEIQPFNILLQPDASTIHYYDGYIVAPGKIDMDNLTFTANSAVDSKEWTDDAPSTDDGFSGTPVTDDETGTNTNPADGSGTDSSGGGGGGRFLRLLDGGVPIEGTAVDVLVFPLPDSCANTPKGCDYTDFGVGGKTADGTLRWCCTNEAIGLGLCSREEASYGRLIVDNDKYTGESRFVNIPKTGDIVKRIKHGVLELQESGHYVVVMANCNEGGRRVQVNGNMIWKSEHGYLPGELYGIMRFYVCMTFIYFIIVLWYATCMRINKDSRIPIEKWILMTILLGLIEMAFQSLDFMAWNKEGYQRRMLAYFAIIIGSLKQGISRCLAVMVALGWGVIRDSLGTTMRTIIVLGTVYTAVSVCVDLLVVFAIEDIQTLSDSQEQSLFDVASVLTFVLATLDVIFFMWMLDALNNTMEYLENMNQTRKLKRYLQLRQIFLFTILASVLWAVFSIVDTYNEQGILLEQNEWVIEAIKELIYLFALLGVAILWRPNPNAKEYAYVMELPSLGATDGENDLELTAGVVPSAMDDFDDEFETPSGKAGGGYGDREIS